MSYTHFFFAPFQVGDPLEVVEGPYKGRHGVVTSRSEEAFLAEDTTYALTFDGEQEACPYIFHFWQLALSEEEGKEYL